jgi:molybdopterin-synthase adenylyltransferase
MDNPEYSEKYSRQTILNKIGVEGQELLHKAKVAIVGLGALGTNTSELLTRSGVGNLTLIDFDTIEHSNLQRQTLFKEEDIKKSKIEIAKRELNKINSLIKIETKQVILNENSIKELNQFDLILDCTDNLETRFLINAFCKTNKIPWIYSACVKTHGYVMPIFPQGPCLKCFLKQTDLDSACTSGVINTIATSISALQTTLAIKIITKKEVKPELIYYDVWNQIFKKMKINPSCELCQIT